MTSDSFSFNTWDLDVTDHNTGAACFEQDDSFIDSGIPSFLIWRVLTCRVITCTHCTLHMSGTRHDPASRVPWSRLHWL